MSHIPASRLCAVCANAAKDCSGLNFKNMPVLVGTGKNSTKHYAPDAAVRCTEFKRVAK